jgi:hypothetical protein
MSELAKKSRAAMKDKAARMAKGDPDARVDASDYHTTDPTSSGQTGKRPTGRQGFKEGGKVSGEHTTVRADRKVRVGHKRPEKMIGGSLAYLSPALMAANAMRGDKDDEHKGPGLKGGGRAKRAAGGPTAGDLVPTSRMAFTGAGGSRLSKALGLKTGGNVSDGEIQGTRPTGGRRARKDGGRAKDGKVNVNIVISPKGGPDAAGPPPMALKPPPPPMPPMPPPGMGPQGPGGPPPMMGAPMGGPPPGLPMPRKRGGRTHVNQDAGAGSGLGRLEKAGLA